MVVLHQSNHTRQQLAQKLLSATASVFLQRNFLYLYRVRVMAIMTVCCGGAQYRNYRNICYRNFLGLVRDKFLDNFFILKKFFDRLPITLILIAFNLESCLYYFCFTWILSPTFPVSYMTTPKTEQ